jgi:hypothetical protein
MADALDDVVHASRFQPGHLAQLLHELFPLEGGASAAGPPERRPPTQTSTNTSNVTGSGVPSAVRSPTIQPIARSTQVSAGFSGGEAVSLRQNRRSRSLMVVGALAVVGAAGFFVWKGNAARTSSDMAHHAVPSDPSRRFNIYVKSEPPGADIFLDGKSKPVGATPISLPIDLNGLSSVQMVLKKPGFEDFQQIITTDSPVSINLQPLEAPPSSAEAPVAPPPAAEAPQSPASDEVDATLKGKRRSSSSAKRGGSGRPKGEIVDPF